VHLVAAILKEIKAIETYYAFPGAEFISSLIGFFKHEEYGSLKSGVSEVLRALSSESYRTNPDSMMNIPINKLNEKRETEDDTKIKKRYFEVLIVDNMFKRDEHILREKLNKLRKDSDRFVYQTLFATTFQDTLLALEFNPNIQACVIRYSVPFKSKISNGVLKS
jgi:arginine decarboxylase